MSEKRLPSARPLFSSGLSAEADGLPEMGAVCRCESRGGLGCSVSSPTKSRLSDGTLCPRCLPNYHSTPHRDYSSRLTLPSSRISAVVAMEDLQPSLPSRPTILALPHELLLDILALVSPQDVSSFSQTCRDANSLINGEGSAPSHLWRRLFLEGWDALPDEEAGHMRSTLQSLTRARTDLRLGARSHPHLAKSHSRALHSLINATHSRLPRGPADDRNEDAPRSRSAATLASMFPPSYVGDRRWAAFVYPRQDVKRLSVWNEETKQERAKRLKASEEKAKKREADMEKKRARSSSGNRGAKSMAPTEAKKRRHNDEEGATSSSRRRSARIQRRTELAASDVFLPPSFLSFLPTERQADRDEQSMMASTRLEGLAECLDEEAAAHLHVLHGVRQMRFPTEEEKDRLLKKAKKKRQVEEAKKQKEVKAAARRLAAKRSAKGKGKRREDKNDSQQDIQPKSTPSRGSRSKVKPSMRRSTAGSEDDSDSLLFSGYESADGDEYAQYPSVMSAQHAPAMPLPAVSVPHFGELPRLYTSSGEGVHAQPRLHDGLNSDDDDLSRRKAGPSRKRDSASRTPSPSPSLDSEGQMDEYFDFREMVEDAYAEGFFASIEHRDAVLKGEADPPPHIDEAMFRLHSRRLAEAAGDNVDSEEEDDDYSAPESASDAYDGAEYDSEYLSADEDDDGDEELTPGLDFETADSIEESNVFLGHPQGPGGDATLRREARGVVYDAGRYGYENAWGPFKPFRTQPAEMRNGRRGPFAGLNLMQLGLGAGAHDEDDDSSDGDIEEVVDMETLDAQAAADGVTWQPGQDEEDDLAATTQAPALTNGTAAIAGSPLATTDEDDEDFSGSEDEEDDSDAAFSDDGLLPPFGGLGPHNFARMVAHVGAYSGSKVRNRLQDEREKLKAQQLQHPALPARTRVDWVLAESIMLVVHANLHYAIHRCGWGSGFMLPRGARGDGGGTSDGTNGRALVMPEIRGPLDACCHKRNRRLLYPHAGWGMSRGEEQPKDKVNGMTEEDSGEQEEGEEKQAARNDTPAVHDWANVESATWMGTYFFLDVSVAQLSTSSRQRNSSSSPFVPPLAVPQLPPLQRPSSRRSRQSQGALGHLVSPVRHRPQRPALHRHLWARSTRAAPSR